MRSIAKVLAAISIMAVRSPTSSLPAGEIKPSQALAAGYRGPSVVAPANPQLASALDRAFAEPEQPPFRHTKAVVVRERRPCRRRALCRGLRHRYADPRFSATKSVMSALTGILVRKGALTLDAARAGRGMAGCRRSQACDHGRSSAAPHRGLALGSSLQASLASALEPVNRMKFMESRHGRLCREHRRSRQRPAAPGIINDGNTVILSHLIRNAAGGTPC